MKEIKGVQGSLAASQPLVIGYDTVYVHSNVKELLDPETGEPNGIYEYDEIQYEKDEYIRMMSEKGDVNRCDIDYLLLMTGVDEEILPEEEPAE